MEVLPKNHFPISYNESLFPLNKANPPKERSHVYVDNCLYTKLRDVDFKGGFQLTQEDIQHEADPVARHLVEEEEEEKFNKGHPVINALNKEEYLKKLMTKHYAEQFKIKKMEQRKAYEEKVKKDLEIRGLNLNPESVAQLVEEHHVNHAIRGALEAPPEVAQHIPRAEDLFGQERYQHDEEAGLRLGGLDIRRNLGYAEIMAHEGVDYEPDLREAVHVDPNRSLATNVLIGLPQRGSTAGMATVNNAGRLASRVDGYLLEADPYDTLLGERQQRRNRVLVDFGEELNVPIQGGTGINFRATIPSGTGGIRWNLLNERGEIKSEDMRGYRKHQDREQLRNYQAKEEAKKTMGKVISGVKEHFDNRQVAQNLVDSLIQDALLLGRQRREAHVEEDEEDEEKNARARQHLKKRAFQKLHATALEKKLSTRNRADIEHALRYEGSAKSQGKLGKHSSKEQLGAGLARAISKGQINKGIIGSLGVGNTSRRTGGGGGGGGDAGEYLNAVIKGEE
jgi:hypothetical protein